MKKGEFDPDDPKTITVKWHSYLLEMQNLVKNIKVRGAIL